MFVKFPLCAHAKPPIAKFAKKGCRFSGLDSPVVEYRTWPMAVLPGSLDKISLLLKLSPTKPCLRTE